MNREFFEHFQSFIRETVLGILDERKNATIFDDLPPVALTEEVAGVMRSSTEVVLWMSKDGMPHTHAGREYRFHRELLIEWTRTGSKPFDCEVCRKKDKEAENENNDPSVNSTPVVRQLSHRTSGKLAQMV